MIVTNVWVFAAACLLNALSKIQTFHLHECKNRRFLQAGDKGCVMPMCFFFQLSFVVCFAFPFFSKLFNFCNLVLVIRSCPQTVICPKGVFCLWKFKVIIYLSKVSFVFTVNNIFFTNFKPYSTVTTTKSRIYCQCVSGDFTFINVLN